MPSSDSPPERCPSCGGEVWELDKDTSSGRDRRLIACQARCGWSNFFDYGRSLSAALREYRRTHEGDAPAQSE